VPKKTYTTKAEYVKVAAGAPAKWADLSGQVGLVVSRGRDSSYVRFGRRYEQIPNDALTDARPGDARTKPKRKRKDPPEASKVNRALRKKHRRKRRSVWAIPTATETNRRRH
jgi:hypothetical protein